MVALGGSLVSMLMLGLLGTGHCVGMCGPLVLALPGRSGRLLPHLLYHLGRILTYTVVGALLGGIGQGLASALGAAADSLDVVAYVQLGLAALAALFMAVLGLARLGLIPEPALLGLASASKIPGFQLVQARAAGGGALWSYLPLGLMLGLLPCGLSFGAFARALPAGGLLEGAVLLTAFGIGTLPGLLLVGTLASGLAQRYRKISDLLSGVLLIGMAASLIADLLSAL